MKTLGGLALRVANEGPIDIGAKVFAPDGSFRFALDIDGKRFAAWLVAIRNICQVAPGCLASSGKYFPVIDRERHEIGFERFHVDNNTPFGVVFQQKLTLFGEFTERLIAVSISA